MGAAYARWRSQRFPILVPGWPTYRLSVEPFRNGTDLDDARGRHQGAAVDLQRPQYATKLELEVAHIAKLELEVRNKNVSMELLLQQSLFPAIAEMLARETGLSRARDPRVHDSGRRT